MTLPAQPVYNVDAARRTGPGRLLMAPLGSAYPTAIGDSWSDDWTDFGLTRDGHTFNYDPSWGALTAAEYLLKIGQVMTGLDLTIDFELIESTARTVALALNGATITTANGTKTLTNVAGPLNAGQDVGRIMVGWISEDGQEQWVYKRCVNTGGLTIAHGADRTKTPGYTVKFNVEVVNGDPDPFVPMWVDTL